MAEMNGGDRDRMACEASNIYCLALYRKLAAPCPVSVVKSQLGQVGAQAKSQLLFVVCNLYGHCVWDPGPPLTPVRPGAVPVASSMAKALELG